MRHPRAPCSACGTAQQQKQQQPPAAQTVVPGFLLSLQQLPAGSRPLRPRFATNPHQLFTAYAAAASPATIPTSKARWAMERAVFFSQQCSGIAALISAMVNGGGAERSKVPSCGYYEQRAVGSH